MLRRIYGVSLKEIRQLRRDSRTLALLTIFPALMLVLYGYALTFDVKHIRLAVLDYDRSATSREFVNGFFRSDYFDYAGALERLSDADRLLDAGDIRAVIVVPPDFGASIEQGERVGVQLLVDGANANTAGITSGYVNLRVREFTIARVSDRMQALGMPVVTLPIQIEQRVWYNPTLETSKFLVPGLIGFLLMLVGAVSTSMSVVREIERNTMEQIVVSSVRSGEFVVGKTLPYVAVGFVTETATIVSAMVLFGMPFKGSVGWLFVASFAFLLCALGVGLLISSIAETQQVAFQITVITTLLPSVLLSDFVFPIASMPKALQLFTYVLPPRHFIVILRSIILKGSNVEAWLAELLFLVGFAAIILTVASLRLRARLRRS